MTTIACDGKTMVSDGRISVGDIVVENACRKVHRLLDGRLIGFAGNAYNWDSVIEFFNKKKKKWPVITGTSSIMVLEKTGAIILYDQDGRTFQRTAPVAIGSGWQFATGAMDSGLNATEAVKIASNRDAFSGGKIFTLNLSDPLKDEL